VQLYSYSLALRIWHPSIDPVVITKKLSITPKHAYMAGRPRQTPNGRLLGGNHAQSYWHADPFAAGEYSSTDEIAEDALADVTKALQPHRHFLLLLREQGARLHLRISSFSRRNYALELSPDFLAECSALGLSIVHDVYPCSQN
jgi:hypothetical protein